MERWASIMVSLFALFLISGCSRDASTHIRTDGITHGPAIISAFDDEIQIKGMSDPFHSDENVIIQPKNNDWSGNHITIYRILSATQQETEKFFKEKVLPTHLEKIGTAPVRNGTWSFPWKIPNLTYTPNYKYGGFWIAVVSDSGMVSGVEVTTFDYKRLDLSPSQVHIGQSVEITGEGLHKDSDIEIYLDRDEPHIHTHRLAKLGSFQTKDGSFSYKFELSKEMDGHEITKGEYIIGVIVIPKNNEIHEAINAYLQVN